MIVQTKKEAVTVITVCARLYGEFLLDKNILFVAVDKHRKVSLIETYFEKGNFLHMTGCRVNPEKITPTVFFDMCLSRRLCEDDFDMSLDGTTAKKLDVLPTLISKNLSANIIGDYSANRLFLYTEKLIGNIRACMGFVLDRKKLIYAPNTILSEDIRDIVVKPYLRIIAAYRKNISDEKYTEIVYAAKKIDWETIVFPAGYDYLPRPQ